MCSGRQPAMTPFTAMFHGVAALLAWGSIAIVSSGLRVVCLRNASTRSGVGAMTGRPSVQRC